MTQVIKLKTGTFKHIEAELHSYHDAKKELIRIKKRWFHEKVDRYGR